ncbi:uncharacterized protein B0H64DRAFT_165452 [Chaetomium fimeti]|uniref:Uncharacterized protein n=1 Tax=Chaetomium fimeti TaxID=1854472 RepID=A0AAE0HGM7_9PEZI|nr:hypothetical protein B0H64DRAFT_165452 [Chaetomium fimeti]
MTNADSNNNHSHSSHDSHDSHDGESSHDNRGDSKNPFIRFRHHVDTNLHAGLSTLMVAAGRRGDPTSTSTSAQTQTQTQASPLATPNPNPDISPTPTSKPNPNPNTPSSPSSPSTMSPSTMSPSPQTMPPSPQTMSPNQHLESRLSLLAGGTPAEAALAWRLFLTRSAYSPLRLEQQHDDDLWGWRPVPRGVSPEVAAQVGWLEAFEDLVRVSSGLGVVDFDSEAVEGGFGGWGGLGLFGLGGFGGSGFGGGGFGRFGGMREVAWLERMHRQGLTEVLFPVYDPGLGYQSPRTMAEWVERRRVEERRERDVGRVWEELVGEGRRAAEREAEAWVEEARREMREMRREVDAWRDAAHETGTSFFDGIGGAVKTLGKVLEDEVKSLRRFGGEEDGKSRDRSADEKDDAPQTESDLYSVIQSAFHESERSLSNFFKLISEGGRAQGPPEPKPISPPKVNTTEAVEDGITKKTTTEEFVDEHGNTHSKTETTWTDENGQVIMKQVHSSMGHSARWEKATQGAPTEPNQAATEGPKEQHRQSGWFWK